MIEEAFENRWKLMVVDSVETEDAVPEEEFVKFIDALIQKKTNQTISYETTLVSRVNPLLFSCPVYLISGLAIILEVKRVRCSGQKDGLITFT